MKSSDTRSRKLAEPSYKLRKVKGEWNLYECTGNQEDQDEDKDDSSKLSNEEMLRRKNTASDFGVEKEKAITAFNNYNEKLKKKFEFTCERIGIDFMLLGKSKKLRRKYLLKYLREYNEAAAEEIEQTLKFFQRRFSIFMRKRIIWLSEYESFINQTDKIWNTIMKHHAKRWRKVLYYKLENPQDF
ncbi:hypothetical protein C922_02526 [Plasmodium inui San Antonio 1]|uniref:Plasmodium RESA N-terminal domain-containing protein n=1 Tax=Plasmodium inui San Antonio 1 TaxID=1237626 RepID=W7A147_9APIC|nr:hypothetical protein C922_02526 [Plasmodium inui San Antonio 1]EUD66942.1 hypothetical protein C922_02526 [Plasmodium inui San Antonio 1]